MVGSRRDASTRAEARPRLGRGPHRGGARRADGVGRTGAGGVALRPVLAETGTRSGDGRAPSAAGPARGAGARRHRAREPAGLAVLRAATGGPWWPAVPHLE